MFRLNVEEVLNGYFNMYRAHNRYPNPFDDDVFKFEPDNFESDEFRMYSFKIKKCPLNRSHDWTVCPYAHRGERARRRDPRRIHYMALICPDYRSAGQCPRGDHCPYAHGVFEYWLHPGKYRTRPCTAGEYCTRPVCFFAHSADELRLEMPNHLAKWARLALKAETEARAVNPDPIIHFPNHICGSSSSQGLGVIAPPTSITSGFRVDQVLENSEPNDQVTLDLLERLRALSINNYYHNIHNNNVHVDHTPNIDWISDLLAG